MAKYIKIEDKYFVKFVDSKGRIMYKENEFDMENNKLVAMNIILGELE